MESRDPLPIRHTPPEPGGWPDPAHVFVPAPAAGRPRENPPRRAGGYAPSPPARSFEPAYGEGDLFWDDSYSERVPDFTICAPYRETPDNPGDFAPREPSAPLEPVSEYQQAYWARLREVSAPFSQAEPPAPPRAGAPDGYQPFHGGAISAAPPPPPQVQARGGYPPLPGGAIPAPAPRASKRERIRQWAARAFLTDRGEGDKPRWGIGRVIAACACTIALIICLVQIGILAVRMLNNEKEMAAARNAYYAQTGVDLERDASRVDPPPPGITFPPTAAPPAPEREAAANGLAGAEEPPASAYRSKTRQYPENPLGNILEAFAEPYLENGDLIGRLTIGGLLDETVVYRNNTYYLTHDAEGQTSPLGAVFMDEACAIRVPPENLHLRGYGVFGPLAGYAEGGADFVRGHAIIGMNTLYEEGEYIVIAVIACAGDSQSPEYFNFAAYPAFESDAQMEAFIAEARQKSLYEIPVDAQPSDRLLTLSTLDDGQQNLVILARKLRAGENPQSLTAAINGVRLRQDPAH